ncbi:hypothetical protein POM88_005115 [Heracleum sosnowskyi]|uniref:Uncharacterized protein n=1 Tax=Heracleum sosnowskyi TaxID=360622 RepID=A0AAD8N8B8_9APIA|nr:hypothetical protein POM88_005115 [Heracleum sosnowskyi]
MGREITGVDRVATIRVSRNLFDTMIKMLSFFFKENEKCGNIFCNLGSGIFWEVLSQQEETVVWRKTSLKKCYSPRESICSYLKAQLIIIISHGESGINVRLLWLDKGSFLDKYRQAFQSEVINLAHSEMKNLVPADSDDLMSYERPARPILKDIIQVAVIPYDLAAKSYEKVCSLFWGKMAISDSRTLGLTLAPTHNADEGVKVIKSTGGTILEPGKNADSDDLMRVLQDYLEGYHSSGTLGLTLAPTHNADEGVKVIKSTGGTILKPGKNADSDDLMRVLQDLS